MWLVAEYCLRFRDIKTRSWRAFGRLVQGRAVHPCYSIHREAEVRCNVTNEFVNRHEVWTGNVVDALRFLRGCQQSALGKVFGEGGCAELVVNNIDGLVTSTPITPLTSSKPKVTLPTRC